MLITLSSFVGESAAASAAGETGVRGVPALSIILSIKLSVSPYLLSISILGGEQF